MADDQIIWDDSVEQGATSSNARASAVINDKSKSFILATIVALNCLGTFAMFAEWRIAERESRLLEYYIMELDGKLMASGVIKYPESWSAHKGERK
jgi:hypothetical protein